MTDETTTPKPRFCSECGTQLIPDARFCQSCGVSVSGRTAGFRPTPAGAPMLRWGIPAAALLALVALTFFKLGDRGNTAMQPPAGTPLASGAMTVPDISAMSPEERANRLFNRVMTLWSEGKTDSALFFAPMALASFEALAPFGAHERYDVGLISLVAGNSAKAAAESDSILAERPNHLLGLILAARVADSHGDSARSRASRKQLLAAEKAERASALPEYRDHEDDITAAIDAARRR